MVWRKGFTPTEAPERLPGFHEYEYPALELLTFKVELLPGHTRVLVAEAEMAGAGFTITGTASRALTHPNPVKGVVMPGLMVPMDNGMIAKSDRLLLSELPWLEILAVEG